jgi:hypothetical protein
MDAMKVGLDAADMFLQERCLLFVVVALSLSNCPKGKLVVTSYNEDRRRRNPITKSSLGLLILSNPESIDTQISKTKHGPRQGAENGAKLEEIWVSAYQRT